MTVGSPPLFGQCPNARSVGLAGTGTATVAGVLLAISHTTGPVRWPGILSFFSTRCVLHTRLPFLGGLSVFWATGVIVVMASVGFFRILNSHTLGMWELL